MIPKLIKGNNQSDSRGTLFYNNDFDATALVTLFCIGE